MAAIRRKSWATLLVALALTVPFAGSYAISTAICYAVSAVSLWRQEAAHWNALERGRDAARREAAARELVAIRERAALAERDRQEAMHAAERAGWSVRIEQASQAWGGPDVGGGSGLGPECRIEYATNVGEYSSEEYWSGGYKVVEIIDDDHVRVRFHSTLADAETWGAVTEAVIDRTPRHLSSATTCGGMYYTYTLLKVEKP